MEQIKKLVRSSKIILFVSFAFLQLGCISLKQDVANNMANSEIYQVFVDSNSRIRKTQKVRLIFSYSAGKYGIEKLMVRSRRVNSDSDPLVRVIKLPEWSFSLDTSKLVNAPDKMIFIKREMHSTDKLDRSARHYISPVVFSKDGTRAAIYYEYVGGSISRGAIIYLFAYKNGKWTLFLKDDDPIT